VARHRIVVTHRIHAETRARLDESGAVVANDRVESWTPEELERRVGDADALMVFMPDRVDEALLDAAPRLRIVAGALKGADNLDVAACVARGVRVTVCPDLLSAPTAELAVALALGLLRNLRTGDEVVRTETYAGWRPVLYGGTLTGARVGILGFGNVGREIARSLRGFEAEVVFHDPEVTEGAFGARPATRDELLATSDVLVLAAPLLPSTRHAIDATALARLPRGAVVVNVGRGSVVDEEAVADALESGSLAGYAADVFAFEDLSDPERPAAVPPRLTAQRDRTLFTPHLGSAVRDVRRAIEREAADAIRDVLAGREPRGAIA
jgi:phosphonate dehydrogenase